jgi:hypothetical protein
MFKELDYRLTPIGPLSLRWRRASPTGADVLEIKLGEEFFDVEPVHRLRPSLCSALLPKEN